MNAAGVAVEHDAFVAILLYEGEPLSVGAQPSKLSDEILQAKIQVIRDGLQLVFFESHITRPFAAGRAALADVVHLGVEHHLAVRRATIGFTHAYGFATISAGTGGGGVYCR